MLTCIACTKQVDNESLEKQQQDKKEEEEEAVATPSTRHAIKNLTSQIKEMALKASGAYKKGCKPCSGRSENRNQADSDTSSVSGRFNYVYRRAAASENSTSRIWGKEMEARLKGLSSGEGTPVSISARTESAVVVVEDDEPKEWVAQVEPGVLITFVSIPRGGNELKRIRFSRELFSKWQAQKWWTENHDRVMELYNVQSSVPPQTPSRTEDEECKIVSSSDNNPVTPPTSKENLPRNHHHSTGYEYSSLDLLDHQEIQASKYKFQGLASAPKVSDIIAAKTETSSFDASARSSSSGEADCSGELSVSNASEIETEWVEQDEPGVHITIRALADGTRELRRVRFSRDMFGEMDARMWWEENKARIQEQYL
ncbi:Protein Brevis radix-like 2 [Dionaea muscipula]